MEERKIVVCNNVTCTYSEDGGSFEGQITWDNSPIVLYLHCDPDDPKEQLIVKLAFETIYREKERWTREAIEFACERYIPYFRFVSGSSDDYMEKVLPQHLVPDSIEFGIDGIFVMAFQSFFIGRRESFLEVMGLVSGGFNRLLDNGVDVPII